MSDMTFVGGWICQCGWYVPSGFTHVCGYDLTTVPPTFVPIDLHVECRAERDRLREENERLKVCEHEHGIQCTECGNQNAMVRSVCGKCGATLMHARMGDIINVQRARAERLTAALKELLRLYDWRKELGAVEKKLNEDCVSCAEGPAIQLKRDLRRYGTEKKAAWQVARSLIEEMEKE